MNYSIGIVTYHARFEKYFKPLVKKLVTVFPDKEIICIANGHPDKELQFAYLQKFIEFVKSFKNVKYFTHEDNQGLTKCWNQLIINCDTKGCLILNDDIQVTELFRDEFEQKIIAKNLKFSAINGSWSHFFITKDIIKEIGWFDENFTGIGQEDADYMFRMTIKNVPITDTACLGIKNYVAPAENPTWKNVSAVTDSKYSSANKEYIKSKYYTAEFNPEITSFDYTLRWRGGLAGFGPKQTDIKNTEYPESFLNYKTTENKYQKKWAIKNTLQKIQYKALSILKKLYYILNSINK
ncbi:MAG: glycosyltransferase [bacterium]